MNNKDIHIGIVGAGNIGTAIFELLVSGTDYQVSVADISDRPWNVPEEKFSQIKTGDWDDHTQFNEFVSGKTLIVNALPFNQNINLHQSCCENDVPYFDLSEDGELEKHLVSQENFPFTMMHCGLAPGMSTIVAWNLLQKVKHPQTLKIRVGALSENADNKLRYYTSWSGDGLVNEYLGDCNVVELGRKKTVPALSGYEKLTIDGREYECFNTGGGIGTLAKTIESVYSPFEGKDGNPPSTIWADYKTIRRIGHHDYVDFLFNDLQLDQSSLTEIFKSCIPKTRKDCVIIFVTASSLERADEQVYYKVFKPQIIHGRYMSAIEYTTATGLIAMVELFLNKKIPQEGLVLQEQAEWSDALQTTYGYLYRESERE